MVDIYFVVFVFLAIVGLLTPALLRAVVGVMPFLLDGGDEVCKCFINMLLTFIIE